jgi:hypothetical protein
MMFARKLKKYRNLSRCLVALGVIVASLASTAPVVAKPSAKDFNLTTSEQLTITAGQKVATRAAVVWVNGPGKQPTYKLAQTLKGAKLSLQQPTASGVTIMITTTPKTPLQRGTFTITARSAGITRKMTAVVVVASRQDVPVPSVAPTTVGAITVLPVPTLPAPTDPSPTLAVPTLPASTVPVTTVPVSTVPAVTISRPKGFKSTGAGTGYLGYLQAIPSGLSVIFKVETTREADIEVEVGSLEAAGIPSQAGYTSVFPNGPSVPAFKARTIENKVQPTFTGLKAGTLYTAIIRAYVQVDAARREVETKFVVFKTKLRIVVVTATEVRLNDDSDALDSGEMGFTLGLNGVWKPTKEGPFSADSGSRFTLYPVDIEYEVNEPLSFALYARDDDSPGNSWEHQVTPDGPTYTQRGFGEAQFEPADGDDSAMVFGECDVLSSSDIGFTRVYTLSTTKYDVKFDVTITCQVKYI